MIALMSVFALTNKVIAADVVFNVVVPNPTYECWMVGSFNGWNNNLHKMTKVDDTHYTITLDDTTFPSGTTVENMMYKYLSGGGDWAYAEEDPIGNGATNPNDNNNRLVDQVPDTVKGWKLLYNPYVEPIPMRVTIDAFVPVEVLELYIVGTFNGWALPTDSTKMTLNETTPEGKIFRVTFHSEDVNKLQYKFVAGPAWDYEQTRATNYQYPDVTQSSAVETVEGFKAIYDASKVGNINITATVPAGTQRVWIMGSHLGWNWDKLQEGTKNTDGTFSFVVNNVMSVSYRLYNWTEAWAYPEADDADATKERAARTAAYPADANLAITVSAWRNVAPNALPSLNADKYNVYTTNRSIVVEGVTSKVDIYDISGRNVESSVLTGTFNSKTLNSGLYIIKVDGATQKVSVK